MHDVAWKVSDSAAVAAPSTHWQRSPSAGPARTIPRPGHSFGGVQIRQSSAPTLQAKLTVSHPQDSAEVEADRVADTVLSMPEPASVAARKEQSDTGTSAIQRQCTECEKPADSTPWQSENATEASKGQTEQVAKSKGEEVQRMADKDDEVQRAEDKDEEVQRAEDKDDKLQASSHAGEVPSVTPAIESDIQSVHGSGSPLPEQTRAYFEPRFGADFSNVRVHTGSQAAGVARKLNARAFTVGDNITFGGGQYAPDSSNGKRLLAHELAHVVQQKGPRS